MEVRVFSTAPFASQDIPTTYVSAMEQALTIRTTDANDVTAIDRLLGSSYPALLKNDYPPSLLVTAVPLIAKAQPKLISTGTYFLAEDEDGAVVAAGGWTRGAPAGGLRQDKTGHIRHVVTDHRRTRQGIGRRLMEHIVSDAQSAGVERLECMSTLTAERFYQACGFTTLGDILVPLRPGIEFPAKAMVRHLGS